MSCRDVVRVAVIGCGGIGTRAHLPSYGRNKNARIEAIVDTSPKVCMRVQKKFGVKRFFSDIDELVDSIEIDAVSICTPPDSHAEIATKALERGINVLCEKPLTDRFEDGLRIVKAAEKSGKILMTGFNRRFWPNYLKVKSAVEGGQMGAVYLVEYHSLQGSPLLGWSKSPWFYNPKVGGSLLDQGPHVFDILNWFLGTPLSVYARSEKHSDSPVDEYCVTVIRYENGKIGVGIMSWLASVQTEKLVVDGTIRSFYASPDFLLDVNPTDFNEISLLKASFSTLSKKIFVGDFNTYQQEIDHFIDCIQKGRRPSPSGWDGLKALAITEAAIESLKSRREVNTCLDRIDNNCSYDASCTH